MNKVPPQRQQWRPSQPGRAGQRRAGPVQGAAGRASWGAAAAAAAAAAPAAAAAATGIFS